MSPKLRIGVTVAVFFGFAALLQFQQLKIKRLVAENAELQSQLGQLGSLGASNDILAKQVKAISQMSLSNQNELLRLRGQVARSRQLDQDNTQLKAQRQQLEQQLQQQQAAAKEEMTP